MRILIGVQFLFAKSLICKAFRYFLTISRLPCYNILKDVNIQAFNTYTSDTCMPYGLREGATHMMFFPLAILMISDESDREFMKALYIKYRMSMFRMARALTDSEQDAEDVVSEACVSLIKKISRIRQLDCNVWEGYIISIRRNRYHLGQWRSIFHRQQQ